jgi:hypothetical protein
LSFFELCFLCFFFVFVPFRVVPSPVFFLGVPHNACAPPNNECAGSAEVGPCLTDAAPKAASGALSVKVSRYAKARTSTSAVAAACCFGGVINTSLQQMSLQHSMGRSASIQAGENMIIPIM